MNSTLFTFYYEDKNKDRIFSKDHTECMQICCCLELEFRPSFLQGKVRDIIIIINIIFCSEKRCFGGFSLLIYHRCRQALIPIYFETKLTIAPPVVLYFLKYISYSKDCLRSVNHWNTTAFWNFKKKYYKLSTFPSKKVIFHCSVFSVNNT